MTTKLAFALGVGALAALGPVAAAADHKAGAKAAPIRVSCARYFSAEVIWDRPSPTFLDSLTAAGYTPERARAIGDRVCRDEAGVGNPAVLEDTMRRILRETPPRH